MAVQGIRPLSASGAVVDERRSDDRITTIYRPVIMEVGEFTGFCLVRNLSAGGLLGMVYAEFAPGNLVTVEFAPHHRVTGAIVWADGQRIGVRFDYEIDVAKTLQELGQKVSDAGINRAPRLPIECPVEIECEGRVTQTRALNISQRGIMVRSSELRSTDEVVVHLAGMETRRAIVRWTDNGMAGLNFVRPIEFEILATWCLEHQMR